jgi:hypothetical protein
LQNPAQQPQARAHLVRNLRGGEEVKLLNGRQDFRASGQASDNADDVARVWLVILAAAPGIAKYEGVGLDSNRKPDLDDVRQAAESLVIVRFLIAENE